MEGEVKRALIGCEIIQSEIEDIILKKNISIDTFWLEESLHNHPLKLKDELQKKIDELYDYDEILLSFGFCGKGLDGICSKHSVLYYVGLDDCVEAYMIEDREELALLRTKCIFTSKAWLNTKNNTVNEYEKSIEKYGQKRTDRIYNAMYAHYKHLLYMQVDDGQIQAEEHEKINRTCEIMGCVPQFKSASLSVYEDLLDCRQTEYIKKAPKGYTITAKDFAKND